MATKSPRIAILGAGPAGLTIASLLTKNSIPYTIFELRPRPSPSFISEPSGSLDLHEESGLKALEACGLMPKFHALTSDTTEDNVIADKMANVRWADNGMGGNRPEIARNSLTNLLLQSIPDGNIRWEHKIRSITSAGSDWRLQFSHNNATDSEDFDLIIGADGAWSKARAAITTTKPYFSSINCITLTIPHISTRAPHLAKLIGTGSYSATGDRKGVMAQRGSMDSARLYLMLQSDSESWLKDERIAGAGAAELKSKLLGDENIFSTWGDKLKDLISTACDCELEAGNEISATPLYMLKPGFKWEHVPGITLVGDAAHLMTPFAGEGVNCAMLDSLELAENIISAIQSSRDLDKAVAGYEEKMFPRTAEVASGTLDNLHMIFEDDAPNGFVRFFESHSGPPEES